MAADLIGPEHLVLEVDDSSIDAQVGHPLGALDGALVPGRQVLTRTGMVGLK